MPFLGCVGDEDARAFCEAQLTRQAAARAADRGKTEVAQQLHERAAVLFKQCGEEMHAKGVGSCQQTCSLVAWRSKVAFVLSVARCWCAVCWIRLTLPRTLVAHPAGKHRQAAGCYEAAGRWGEAGDVWVACGEGLLAAGCYEKAKRWQDALARWACGQAAALSISSTVPWSTSVAAPDVLMRVAYWLHVVAAYASAPPARDPAVAAMSHHSLYTMQLCASPDLSYAGWLPYAAPTLCCWTAPAGPPACRMTTWRVWRRWSAGQLLLRGHQR